MRRKPNPHNLVQYRSRMGLTRGQVAKLLGHYDSSMVRRYERGASMPPLSVALSLEIIYRVPVAFLYQSLYQKLRHRIRDDEKSSGLAREPILEN